MKILEFVSNHVKRSLEIIFRNILTVNMERTQSGHSVPYPRTKRLFGLLTVPFHIAGAQDVNSTLKVSHFINFLFFFYLVRSSPGPIYVLQQSTDEPQVKA